MGTALKPEPVDALASHARARLVEEEMDRLISYYRAYPDAMRPTQLSLEEWVETVVQSHEQLLARWGAWYWQSKQHTGPQAADTEDVADIVVKTAHEFENGGTITVKGTTEYLPPLRFSKRRELWGSDAEENLIDPDPPRVDNQFTQRLAQSTGDLYFTPYEYVHVRKGQSIAKAVLKRLREEPNRFPPTYYAMWARIFDRLGELWARREKLNMVLTCAPSVWMQLGSLGESSCYRCGAEQEHSKLNLSVVSNSVVALVYREKSVMPTHVLRGDSPVARAWGFLVPEHHGAVFGNAYLLTMHHLDSFFKKVLSQLWGVHMEGGQRLGEDYVYVYARDELWYSNSDQLLYHANTVEAEVIATHIRHVVRRSTPLIHNTSCVVCDELIQRLDNESNCQHCAGALHEGCGDRCERCETHFCTTCGNTQLQLVLRSHAEVYWCVDCQPDTRCAACSLLVEDPEFTAEGTAYCVNCFNQETVTWECSACLERHDNAVVHCGCNGDEKAATPSTDIA